MMFLSNLVRYFPFQLSNHLFEELAMDVYDEVDRRENNTSKWIMFLLTYYKVNVSVKFSVRNSFLWRLYFSFKTLYYKF